MFSVDRWLRSPSLFAFPGALILSMIAFGVWFDRLSDEAGPVSVRAVELALDGDMLPAEVEWLAWRAPTPSMPGGTAQPPAPSSRRPS